MAEDKINFKKAILGVFKPVNYIKASTFLINLAIIFALILGIKTAISWLFPTKNNQTQNQTSSFVVEKGATVKNLTVISKQAQEKTKKTTGLEFEASSKDAGLNFKKYLNNNWYVGVGARWRFETKDDDLSVVPTVKLGVDF